MKISICARVMIFFQPLLLVNFVVDRNEAYTAKSCLRCTRKSVSEFNLRYLNSIPKRVTDERRRADAAERATSDAGDEALLHDEAQAGGVRLMPAEEVQLTPPGANYFVLTPEGSKRERREKRTQWSRLAAAGATERAPA